MTVQNEALICHVNGGRDINVGKSFMPFSIMKTS